MSNVSVRNPSAGAYREALAAVEQFERQGVSLDSDRVFLKRLKSPRYVDEVTRAWLDIADRKRPGDDLLLIKFMFAAWHYAQEAPSISEAFGGPAENVSQGRWCAEYLIAFLRSGRVSPSGLQTLANCDQALRSLEWLRDMLVQGEREIGLTVSSVPLTRKSKATTAIPGIFMFSMSVTMRNMFGKPLDDAVAALTTVAFDAFEKKFTAAQVQRAVRSRA